MADQALVIPVYEIPVAVMLAPRVHTNMYQQGFTRWQTEEVWIDKSK